MGSQDLNFHFFIIFTLILVLSKSAFVYSGMTLMFCHVKCEFTRLCHHFYIIEPNIFDLLCINMDDTL